MSALIRNAANKAGFSTTSKGTNEMTSLIEQLTRETNVLNRKRIMGVALHLLCDILEKPLNSLEGMIRKITGYTGQGGIQHPLFPEGKNLEKLRARIIGTAVSDCQIRGSKGLIYFENDVERIERFQQTLSNFGKFPVKKKFRKDKGVNEVYINNVICSAVIHWGIPRGDRTILNYGLPDDTRDWCVDSKRALIQDMISQEGCVSDNGEISWERRHALRMGTKKSRSYDLVPRIDDRAVWFLQNSEEMNREYESSAIGEVFITISHLKELLESGEKNYPVHARDILHAVEGYPNQLIIDEVAIVREFGLKVELDPVLVSYYKSGRVSVRWRARIRENESKIKSAFLIRPNHEKKALKQDTWIATQPVEQVMKIKSELINAGFHII